MSINSQLLESACEFLKKMIHDNITFQLSMQEGSCPACERPCRSAIEAAESDVIMRDLTSRVCVCVSRLDSNALVCDCGMMWLSDMLKDGHLQAAVTCDQPSSMAGQSLLSVLDDIVCRESHTSSSHVIYVFLIYTTCLTVRTEALITIGIFGS